MKNCNCNHQINSGCSKIYLDDYCNLYINDTASTEEYVYAFIVEYSNYEGKGDTVTLIKEEQFSELKVASQGDGLYTILKLTIPKDETATYYYKDENFYKGEEIVDLQELIDVNPTVSGIQQEYIYYFSTCNLKKCFISVIQSIFKATSSICKAPSVDYSITYRRDLLWMALNVIEYMADLKQFDEAKRLLFEITECNGLCPQDKLKSCGCNL